MIIINFITIKLTSISLASSLTNIPFACLCVAIHIFRWSSKYEKTHQNQQGIYHIYHTINGETNMVDGLGN